MAQLLTTDFVITNRPGFYFKNNVKSNPVGVGVSGNIIIIGEASGGAKYTEESLRDNWFTPDQLDRVIQKYVSGNIVDAFRSMSVPSSDADITGAPNRIYIVKTNGGAKAQASVASAYGVLRDKNFGIDGNKYFYQVTNVNEEVGASQEGVAIADYSALAGAKFSFRAQGGATTVIDVFTGVAADYDTIAEVVALIDAALPAGFSCVAGVAADTIKIQSDVDATAHQKAYSKSFEIIETDAGDLAALGLAEGLSSSSQEPRVQIDIKRIDNNVNESFLADAEVAIQLGYVGTTATVTITSTTLTTSVTGGAGANLSINLSEYTTIKDLADFINSQAGYSAASASSSNQLSPLFLDEVAALGCCTTGGFNSAKIKKGQYNTQRAFSQSVVLDFVPTAQAGLPDEMVTVSFLTGGAKGSTLAADIANAMIAIEAVNTNFVVPLFSRNASEDIAEGLTESGSTYTIGAVNALVKNHVLKMSTAKVKKHRSCFLSIWDTYANAKVAASTAANYRVAMSMQRSSQVNSAGETISYLPWHTACVAAGMQAAGFYKSIFNKFVNIISFEDPVGFDSGSNGDIEDAINAGILFLEKEIIGNKFVADQTTYGQDTNFVYNSVQATYAADLVSLDLAASFHTAFTGKSLADFDAATGLSFLASKMAVYKDQRLIVASDDAPLGYLNGKVSVNGPVMSVSVEIKLNNSLYFGVINIDISQASSSAEQ